MNTNRLLRVSRLEHAEIQGQMLADFLNTAKGLPSYTQPVRILDLCRELDLLRRMRPPLTSPPESSAEIIRYENKRARIMETLNRALREYPVVPVFGGDDYYYVNWIPFGPQKVSDIEIARMKESGKVAVSPTGAVKIALEMTETGTLDRVRQCHCGRWFFAASNKKVVCSDACRFEKYKQQNGQDFKRKRAKYMRDRYRNPKTRVKQKKGNAGT